MLNLFFSDKLWTLKLTFYMKHPAIDFYIYGLCAVSIEPTLEAQNFIVRPAMVTLLRGLYLWNRKPD